MYNYIIHAAREQFIASYYHYLTFNEDLIIDIEFSPVASEMFQQ